MNDDADNFPVLRAGAAAMAIPLDAGQIEQFQRLRTLLLEWNTRINLTAITDPAEVETRHFLDSLTCALALPPHERARPLRVLDIGSGAGFPALPLAIAFPHWRVTSLDATGKKIRFQEEVVANLGLTNLRPLHGRAEELVRQPGERESLSIRDGAGGRGATHAAGILLPVHLHQLPYRACPRRATWPTRSRLASARRRSWARSCSTRFPSPFHRWTTGAFLLVADQMRRCPPQYPRPAGAPTKHPLGAT